MDWRKKPAVALLLVALVAFGALQPLLPHTDDGCPTEIHCQACRLGLASLAVVEALHTTTPHLLVQPCDPARRESTLELLASSPRLLRGPPSA